MACKIGFAIIGAGVAAHFHAKAIRETDCAELTGVYGSIQSEREQFAAAYNIKAYSSTEELYNDSRVDAVCVCTPSGLHAECAIEAISHRKNVLIEKPVALNVEDCKRIIDAQMKYNVCCGAVSQHRFLDTGIAIRSAIDSGALGRIVSAGVHMMYYRAPEYYTNSGWRGTWALDGGGALMNQGIHGIDLMRFYMGEINSVFSFCRTLVHKIEVEDTAAAIVEYKNGAVGVIEGTTSVYPGYPRKFEVCGSEGSIIAEEERIVSWDVKLPHPDTGHAHGLKHGASDPAGISILGHRRQIEDICHAINCGTKTKYDVENAMKTVELVCAIYKSSKTGERVYL